MGKEIFCIKVTALLPVLKEQIKALWKSTFGDDDEYIERAFGSFLSEALCFYTLCDKDIACVFFTIPTQFKYSDKICRAFYLYGAATKEALRGKGLFTELFLFAKESLKSNHSADFIFLVPAKQELFNFYRSFSFTDTAFYENREIKAEDCGYNFIRESSVPESLYSLYCKNALSYSHSLVKSEELFVYSVHDKMQDGYILYTFDGGFLLERDGEIFHLCTSSDVDAHQVCASFAAFTGKESVSANIFAEDGKPLCMALSLCESKVENILCSLLFE